MENLDIIILTSIVSTLFIVFGILMYREFSNVEKNGWKYDPNAKKYGRDALFEIMARLFEDEAPKKIRTKISKKDKEIIYKAMNRTIADMESDGIYFPEEVKEQLKEYREELNCEYSGLPSPKAYQNN
jgi:cation transport regulator ChaB